MTVCGNGVGLLGDTSASCGSDTSTGGIIAPPPPATTPGGTDTGTSGTPGRCTATESVFVSVLRSVLSTSTASSTSPVPDQTQPRWSGRRAASAAPTATSSTSRAPT